MASVLTAPVSSLPVLEYLVLDANAIIHGHGADFQKKAKHIVTIPEVLDEIKDEHARELLGRLPYTIELREPSVESCRAVAQFALKSGDYNALSKPDIRLIALTHMLQQQQRQLVDGGEVAPTTQETAPVASAVAVGAKGAAELPSAADMKKSNWSRALFAGKLSAPPAAPVAATSSSSAAAATVEDVTVPGDDDAASPDAALTPLFGEDDFPALGSGGFGDFSDDDDDDDFERPVGADDDDVGDVDDVDEEALRYEVEVDGDDDGSDDAEVDERDEAAVAADEEAAPVAIVATETPQSVPSPEREPVHTHDVDCPCREVSAEEMAEFDAQATMVGAAAVAAAAPSEAGAGAGGKKKKMRHKTAQKLLERGEQDAVPAHLLQKLAAQPPASSSSAAATAAGARASAPRVPQSKDEAEDDGVGWISASNADQAERLTRWRLPRSAATAPVAGAADGAVEAAPGAEQTSVEDAASASAATSLPSRRAPPTVSWEGVSVVCCTSDFSMQNVLVQLGLRVVSPNGQSIRAVRRYVMYCNACYRIHRKESDLTRLFCAYCGANHLSRVNCTVLDSGEVKLHLKRNYALSQKGTKYSLPAPGMQPRFKGELLLREDQLLSGIWRQRALRVKKEVASAFGEEVASELGVHVNKGAKIVFGLGKKNNPNAMKGRERRGKSRTTTQAK